MPDILANIPPSEKDSSASSSRRQGIMLCYPFEEKRLAKWKPPYLVDPKLDGERCRDVGEFKFGEYVPLLVSSELNPIISLQHISSALRKLNERIRRSLNSHISGYRLDGELYVHGWQFEQIHSCVSRSVNPHPLANEIRFHVFDIWNSDKPQYERRTILTSVSKLFPPELILVPTKLCYNLQEVLNAYDYYIDQGYEGIVIRNIDNVYVPRRSTFLMKFKPKKRDHYEIVSVHEAISQQGVPKKMVGSLGVAADSGDIFEVSPGTGCTEEKKKLWWQNRDELLGKVLLVEYQNLTAKRKVPRFGRFPLETNKWMKAIPSEE